MNREWMVWMNGELSLRQRLLAPFSILSLLFCVWGCCGGVCGIYSLDMVSRGSKLPPSDELAMGPLTVNTNFQQSPTQFAARPRLCSV